MHVTEAGVTVTWGGGSIWTGRRHEEPLDPGNGPGTCMETCVNTRAYSCPQVAPACEKTGPMDRHPHRGHCSPPADVPPWAQTQVRVQLTLTPSNSHRATCPPEHMHTQSPSTRGSAAGVAGQIRKVNSCSDDTGPSQLPTRISKREETLAQVFGWAAGGVYGHNAASSQQAPSMACSTRGPGERSQSPLLPGSPSFWAKTLPDQPWGQH